MQVEVIIESLLPASQVLTNGDEVKLQRNALSVIEAPSGHEEHDENEDNPFSSGTSLGV